MAKIENVEQFPCCWLVSVRRQVILCKQIPTNDCSVNRVATCQGKTKFSPGLGKVSEF